MYFYTEFNPKGADPIANSVDPDQTAPLGAISRRYQGFCKEIVDMSIHNIAFYVWRNKSAAGMQHTPPPDIL